MSRARARRHAAAACLFAALLASAGCEACRDRPQPITDTPRAAQPKQAEKAVLRGVVRLAEGAELPAYSHEQMERKVLAHTERAPLPDDCSPPKTADRMPVQLTPEGALTNIVIAASGFSQQPSRPSLTHEVMIEDCRLTPKLVLAMKGDRLRVRNAGNYPFMPTYGGDEVVRTLISGQTYDVQLDAPGVSPLVCGFTAPCGRTDVVVMLHPIATVTSAEGKFELDPFPAGEDIQLSAWHPLFEESTVSVRVEPGEERSIELVIRPRGAAPEAAQPETAQPATAP